MKLSWTETIYPNLTFNERTDNVPMKNKKSTHYYRLIQTIEQHRCDAEILNKIFEVAYHK